MYQDSTRYALLALMAVAACSDGDAGKSDDAGLDFGPRLDGSLVPVSPAVPDAALPPAAGSGGQSAARMPLYTTPETALLLKPGAPPPLINVFMPSQVSYFKLEGEAGDFWALATEVDQFTPDNVISLLDSEGDVIATNDDGSIWPGDRIDARLVVRLPQSGTHYVRVVDDTTPAVSISGSPIGLLFYHLRATKLAPESPGFVFGSTEGVDVAFEVDQETGFSHTTLVGELRAGEVHGFSFHGQPEHALIGRLLPAGAQGDGSTSVPTLVRAFTGERTIARIEGGTGQGFLHPPVGDETYQLELEGGDEPGDNGFYALDVVLLPENPREQADADNGQPAGAEEITSSGINRTRGLLLSTLPPDDVDYYRFDVGEPPQQVLVGCEGESGGSGVRGLRAEVRDAADEVLVSAVESATENLQIAPFALPSAGRYYLRLSSETPMSSGHPEPWTRCVVRLGN